MKEMVVMRGEDKGRGRTEKKTSSLFHLFYFFLQEREETIEEGNEGRRET